MSEDRTAEFLSLAKSLPQDRLQAKPASITSHGGSIASPDGATTPYSGRYGNNNATSAQNNPAFNELRSFHQTASGISRDIAATSLMLSELTKLVRRNKTSLFVDDAPKVNQLVVKIKSSIEGLHGRLDDANQHMQMQKRKLGRQAGQEASNLVGQLQEEFVQATAGFKKVLQERSDNMKESSDQKKQVYGGNVDFVRLDNRPPVYMNKETTPTNQTQPPSNPNSPFPTLDLTSGMMAGEPTGSTLPRPHGAIGEGTGSMFTTPDLRLRRTPSDVPTYSGSTSSFGTPLTPLDIQRMEEQQVGGSQVTQLIPDQTYLRERADAMSTVEAHIAELGQIFNKLAVMVSEHRDMVQRVEDNVDDANTNINLSMDVLTDTLANLRSNRALATKVFGVVVVFIILFIVFFA